MHTPFRRFLLTSAVCGTLALSFQALAEGDNGRYGTWNDPRSAQTTTTSNKDLKGLLQELNKLIGEAEQARAADRMFLRDLKDLAARYENPWSVRILSDDFMDGDYTRSPQWSVSSGEYWVEQGYGLRNKTTVATAQPAQPKKVSKEQLAISILGAVLNGRNKSANNAPPPSQTVTKPASISTRARITNAFALKTEMSSWNTQGNFEIGLTQGTSGAGYRLIYTPSQSGGQANLELVKVTSRGQGVIDAAPVTALEDKRTHTISWTRDKMGQMSVSVDGKSILTAQDRSFRDAFSAVQLTSDGADVIVKSISIMGTR